MIPPRQDRQDGGHHRAQCGLIGLDGGEAHAGEGSPAVGAAEAAAATLKGGTGDAAGCHVSVGWPVPLLLLLLLVLPLTWLSQLGLPLLLLPPLLLPLPPSLLLALVLLQLVRPALLLLLPLHLPNVPPLLLLPSLLRLLPLLPPHSGMLPLGLLLARATRVRAGAVSLGLLELLPLLLLLLLLHPLLALGPSQPVPVLAVGPAHGEAPGVSTSRRVSPVALLVPADVVPPDRLAELPLGVGIASWILHLGSCLNL